MTLVELLYRFASTSYSLYLCSFVFFFISEGSKNGQYKSQLKEEMNLLVFDFCKSFQKWYEHRARRLKESMIKSIKNDNESRERIYKVLKLESPKRNFIKNVDYDQLKDRRRRSVTLQSSCPHTGESSA